LLAFIGVLKLCLLVGLSAAFLASLGLDGLDLVDDAL